MDASGPATGTWLRSIDAMYELVELIEGRVDDHTIDDDGIEGVTMRIYNVPKTAVDPFRHWHGAGY